MTAPRPAADAQTPDPQDPWLAAQEGDPRPWARCTGAGDCPEVWHEHGCYADQGQCSDPTDHQRHSDDLEQRLTAMPGRGKSQTHLRKSDVVDLVREVDRDWFAQTVARKQADANRVAAQGGDRVGTLADLEVCRRCGGENVGWYAPSPLWNLVMRGNDINGDALFHDLVCLRCFVVLAKEAGVEGHWRLSVTPEPDGLIYETPTGRVWNPESDLWNAATVTL